MEKLILGIEQSSLLDKHILFDTNSIIHCMEYDCEDLIIDLKLRGIINLVTIDPVLLELQRSTSSKDRSIRINFISNNEFVVLPFTVAEIKLASGLQNQLALYNCFPSPTDLYIGSFAKRYSHNLLIMTGNLKDFPEPVYKRIGYIIFQNEKSARVDYLLQYSSESH